MTFRFGVWRAQTEFATSAGERERDAGFLTLRVASPLRWRWERSQNESDAGVGRTLALGRSQNGSLMRWRQVE